MVALTIKGKKYCSKWCKRCGRKFITTARKCTVCEGCSFGPYSSAVTRGLTENEYKDVILKGNFKKYSPKKKSWKI